MFLDGCHAALLRKIGCDPASIPSETRILSASTEAHLNFDNIGGESLDADADAAIAAMMFRR